MKRKRYSAEQLVSALRQVESGSAVVEICCKLGVAEQTFYRWKKKYSGVGVSELRELRQLREENRKLKLLVADLSLDKRTGELSQKQNRKAQESHLLAVQQWGGGIDLGLNKS